MLIFAVLAMAAMAAPVWIVSDNVDGLMVSWKAPQRAQIHVFVTTGVATKTYPLDRVTGTMIIATPTPPYRIGYQIEAEPAVTLAESGKLRSQAEHATEVSLTDRVGASMTPVAIRFGSGFERASLVAPLPPDHLKTTLQRATKTIELFIKVDPSGKVTGTSSPYYRDPIRRDLAQAASNTAIKRWRFQRQTQTTYRDARLQLSFSRHGTKIRAYPT